jgi:hypothetical protein
MIRISMCDGNVEILSAPIMAKTRFEAYSTTLDYSITAAHSTTQAIKTVL